MASSLNAINGFNKVLNKLKITSVQNGSLKAEFKVTEDCVNEHQKMHSGFSASVVDVMTGVGMQSLSENHVTYVSLDMHVSFLQTAHLGDEILLETRTLKKGKSLCYLEAELRNKGTNDLVAKGRQIVYILNR